MQAPTHFLVGIIIQKLILAKTTISYPLQILIIAILAFLSHFIVDCFSRFTYHPPKADWQDKFWVGYHLSIYVLSIIIPFIFGIFYWPAIVFSILVDIIDWLILRVILKKDPLFHPFILKLQNYLFGEKSFIYEKWTIIFEAILIAILWVGITIIK